MDLVPLITERIPILPTSQKPLSFRGHLPGLDVLRGVAIFFVLIYHGFELRVPYAEFTGLARVWVYLTSWGPTGVPLFFVLSGFLITGIVLDGRHLSTKNFFENFYRRRALRILPAYLLMLVVLKALGIISWKFVLAAVLFIANMASVVGADSGQYLTFWSLAVEEQFYLVWPFLVRKLAIRRLALLGILSTAIILGMQLMAARWFAHIDLRYKLWGNLPSLMAGSLIAIGLRGDFIRRHTIRRYIAGCLFGACLTAPIIYLVDSGSVPSLGALYRLPFILGFAAMLLIVVARNGPVDKLSNPVAKIFAFLGYISYGLYLVHQLLFILFDRAFEGTRLIGRGIANLVLEWFVCVAVSVFVAYLSRRYIEAWFLRRAPHSRDVRQTAAVSASNERQNFPLPSD